MLCGEAIRHEVYKWKGENTIQNYRFYRSSTHATGSFNDSQERGEPAELLALM